MSNENRHRDYWGFAAAFFLIAVPVQIMSPGHTIYWACAAMSIISFAIGGGFWIHKRNKERST